MSGAVGGGTRKLKIQGENEVRVSGDWRKVTQVDACAGEQEQRPIMLRVTGKLENPEHYDPSVPRTLHSDALKPAAASVIPKAPAITSIDRPGAEAVRVTWKPAADHPDQVLLMERKPFYSSEIGLWHPYTCQRDVQVRATSIDRKLERDSDIPLRPVRTPTGSASSRTASSAICAPRSPSPSSHNPSPAAGRSARSPCPGPARSPGGDGGFNRTVGFPTTSVPASPRTTRHGQGKRRRIASPRAGSCMAGYGLRDRLADFKTAMLPGSRRGDMITPRINLITHPGADT
ncbi:hypothetical protein OG528_31370 [Streptomyces platensis]|uniref:hypothetical protein n=1 Tax=Streptomyces platensis TaxID=58346 RepID=UPI0030E23ED6